jgi:type IV secretory pathway VirB2 component (pilin)
MKRFPRGVSEGTLAAALVIALPVRSWAESVQPGALPWDQPLNTIAALLRGPIAHAFLTFTLTIAFVIYGIQGKCEPARRLLRAGFATAVAIEAVKLLNYLLPY